MAASAKAILSEAVRLSDVADVIGILAGLPSERQTFERGEGTHVWVNGVRARGHDGIPAMATIELSGLTIDGETNHSCTYHFENDYGAGGRLVMAAATPFWCAVLKGLVEVFGGTVDYDDGGGSTDVDYGSYGVANVLWNASDGEAWEHKVAIIDAIKPLTRADMDAVRDQSGYPRRGYEHRASAMKIVEETEITVSVGPRRPR